jgi:deoxyribonuclease V
MKLTVDTQYADNATATAGVLFSDWTDPAPTRTLSCALDTAAAYRPGEFYRRELPPILSLLRSVSDPVEVIIIDGYVWLDRSGRPGLGAHLFEALGRRSAVVGVAKNPFGASEHAQLVLRGRSTRPLYVTAAGCDPAVSGSNSCTFWPNAISSCSPGRLQATSTAPSGPSKTKP